MNKKRTLSIALMLTLSGVSFGNNFSAVIFLDETSYTDGNTGGATPVTPPEPIVPPAEEPVVPASVIKFNTVEASNQSWLGIDENDVLWAKGVNYGGEMG